MKKVIILFILLIASPSMAATYYARQSGGAINKAASVGPCSTEANCMNRTVLNAVADFDPGDIIIMCNDGGAFTGAITPASSGTAGAGNEITFRSEDGETFTVSDSTFYAINVSNQSNLIFRGIESDTSTQSGVLIYSSTADVTNITLDTINSHDSGHQGILINNNSDAYTISNINIVDSLLTDNEKAGALELVTALKKGTISGVTYTRTVASGNNKNAGYDSQGFTSVVSPTVLTSGWTQVGATDVWYQEIAEPQRVFQILWADQSSAENRELTEATGDCTDDEVTTDGKWCWSTPNLYVNLGSSIDPDDKTINVLHGIVTDITYKNCTATGTKTKDDKDGNGFYADWGTINFVMDGCSSYLNEGAGAAMTAATDPIIRYSELFLNGTDPDVAAVNGNGITVLRHSTGVLIYNNVIDRNDIDGISMDVAIGGTVTIRNNHITNNTIGIDDDEDSYTATENYNNLYGNDTARNDIDEGANPFAASPEYVNQSVYDYRIKPGSVGENAGTDLSIALDKANNAVSDPPDIGAYEIVKTFSGVNH